MADWTMASSVSSGKRPKSVIPTPVIIGCFISLLLEGVVGRPVRQREGHHAHAAFDRRRASIEQEPTEGANARLEVDHRQCVGGLFLARMDHREAVEGPGRAELDFLDLLLVVNEFDRRKLGWLTACLC